MTTQGHHEATRPYQLGIDVGSTTVKAVVLDGNRRLFSDYRRHNADVRASLGALLADVERALPGARVHAAITGSGGLTTARAMGIPFVQEVIAGTEATQRLHPEVDVVIELGGEEGPQGCAHVGVVAPVVGEKTAISIQNDRLDRRRADIDAELIGARCLVVTLCCHDVPPESSPQLRKPKAQSQRRPPTTGTR